jgi:hypothetical protein
MVLEFLRITASEPPEKATGVKKERVRAPKAGRVCRS